MEYRKIIAGFKSDNLILAEELICDMFFSSHINGVVCHLPLTEPDEGFGTPTPMVPGGNRIEGYLPETPDVDKILVQLMCRAEKLAQDGIHVNIQTESVADQDWAHAWKQHFHVIRITDRIVVKPVWKPFDPGPDDLVIHLDPGMAFGTGTHPSTCMCLKQIQEGLLPGQRFLDVGCGSGILMIAAAKLGASRVVGIDTDPVAVSVTKDNLEINEVPSDQYRLCTGTLDQMDHTEYDLVAANIIAQTLVAIMADICQRMAPDGRAVLSGIIRERLPDVETALEQHGLAILNQDTDAEWVTITVGRKFH